MSDAILILHVVFILSTTAYTMQTQCKSTSDMFNVFINCLYYFFVPSELLLFKSAIYIYILIVSSMYSVYQSEHGTEDLFSPLFIFYQLKLLIVPSLVFFELQSLSAESCCFNSWHVCFYNAVCQCLPLAKSKQHCKHSALKFFS